MTKPPIGEAFAKVRGLTVEAAAERARNAIAAFKAITEARDVERARAVVARAEGNPDLAAELDATPPEWLAAYDERKAAVAALVKVLGISPLDLKYCL